MHPKLLLLGRRFGSVLIITKLNSIVVRDAFPLPQIDEALQAVNNCQWSTSFHMAQGYLQMSVAESDIHKTAFRAG